MAGIVRAQPTEPSFDKKLLEVGARTRTYLVHEPPQQSESQPLPVVLALHGGGSNAAAMMRFSGLNETADQYGFFAVYPNGTGRYRGRYSWNAGNCCAYGQINQVDDVQFIRLLIRELKSFYPVDGRRIYATGMSNGAMMVYRLASELADEIAAIAPVAGAMAMNNCSPSQPVSVVHFHGKDDQFAPFEGGIGARSFLKIAHISVEHTVRAWVVANGCDREPVRTLLPQKVSDGTSVRKQVYGGGERGSQVSIYTIEGGGHTWPGRESPLKQLGRSTQNLSANAVMWEFFERHSRQSSDARPQEGGILAPEREEDP